MHTSKLVFAQLMEHLPLMTADVAQTLIPLVAGLLSAFVAYGRWRLAPLSGLSHPTGDA